MSAAPTTLGGVVIGSGIGSSAWISAYEMACSSSSSTAASETDGFLCSSSAGSTILDSATTMSESGASFAFLIAASASSGAITIGSKSRTNFVGIS